MKTNQKLLLATAVLLLLSAFTYRHSVGKAERFERGQKFLQNLNPDDISEILVTKGDDNTHLRRSADGERFVVVTANGYRAKNQSVNRFLKDALGIELEKEVGTGQGLHEELELTAESSESTRIVFKNSAGNEMLGFLIGKATEAGNGNYVRRTDSKAEGEEPTVYLTSKRVYLDTSSDDFVDKEILDVPSSDINAIRGQGFVFAKGGVDGESGDGGDGGEEGEYGESNSGSTANSGPLSLVDLPAGKKESTKASQVKSALSGLRFTKHHLADAPEVQGLAFNRSLEFELNDGSGYVVAVAQQGDRHYLRIEGFHTAENLSIARDADEEEVKQTSEVLQRMDELQTFNAFHGSWVYEVTDITAERIAVDPSDLVEDA